MDTIAAAKKGARTTWAAGNFDKVAEHIWEVGGVAAAAAGSGPGDEVLDIAAGSGNAAVQAAQRGAKVVASDLTPELFEPGRARAAAAGVELEWVEADAEALPFADDSFDVILSTFGIMFAPRHDVAAAEAARVLRPGGRMALCCWTPDGYIGKFFPALAAFLPAPDPAAMPSGPPTRWGAEDHVRELFADSGIALSFERRDLIFRSPSLEEYIDEFAENFGPLVMVRSALEGQGRWDDARTTLLEFARGWAKPDGDGFAITAEYLLTTGRAA